MSDAPRRLQRYRTLGWRMPENTVYVGRPGRHGNRFSAGQRHLVHGWLMSHQEAVDLHREWCMAPEQTIYRQRVVRELRGRNVACWCDIYTSCHGDTLLEIANAPLRCAAVDGGGDA